MKKLIFLPFLFLLVLACEQHVEVDSLVEPESTAFGSGCSISGSLEPCTDVSNTYSLTGCSGVGAVTWNISGGSYSLSGSGTSVGITFNDSNTDYSILTTYRVGRATYLQDLDVTSKACSSNCGISGPDSTCLNVTNTFEYNCPGQQVVGWNVFGGTHTISSSNGSADIAFTESCKMYQVSVSYVTNGSLNEKFYDVWVEACNGSFCP